MSQRQKFQKKAKAAQLKADALVNFAKGAKEVERARAEAKALEEKAAAAAAAAVAAEAAIKEEQRQELFRGGALYRTDLGLSSDSEESIGGDFLDVELLKPKAAPKAPPPDRPKKKKKEIPESSTLRWQYPPSHQPK